MTKSKEKFTEKGGADMTQVVMNKQKTIALIAHDHQKEDLVEWCVRNQEELKKHFLCGTGTTSKMIAEATGLPVKPYKSGPLGGDRRASGWDHRCDCNRPRPTHAAGKGGFF